jgi:hypothetical protein
VRVLDEEPPRLDILIPLSACYPCVCPRVRKTCEEISEYIGKRGLLFVAVYSLKSREGLGKETMKRRINIGRHYRGGYAMRRPNRHVLRAFFTSQILCIWNIAKTHISLLLERQRPFVSTKFFSAYTALRLLAHTKDRCYLRK